MPDAIIDATGHSSRVSPEMMVAGLPLLERSLRLADVVGCSRAVVVGSDSFADTLRRLSEASRADLEVSVETTEATEVGAVVDAGRRAFDEDGDGSETVYLSSTTVYRRQLVGACLEAAQTTSSPTVAVGSVAENDAQSPPVVAVSAGLLGSRPTAPDFADAATLSELVDALTNRDKIQRKSVTEPRGWAVEVTDSESADHAADHLWDDCRKPVDGIISRNFNRHVSLAVSRQIAPLQVSPNQISAFTFLFGIAAAVCAAVGGFWPFLAAGLLYQINAIADGIDGEIARVKYEFSVTGEWIDTVTDDLKDVVLYAGLGWGAWQTGVAAFGGFGPGLWLALGGVAVGGKLLSMLGYYTFLASKGRGDMYAFQWSFESDDDQSQSGLAPLLSNLKYLTKDDFAVFLGMSLAIAGVFPWFLVVAAAGQLVVAVSVFIQRMNDFE